MVYGALNIKINNYLVHRYTADRITSSLIVDRCRSERSALHTYDDTRMTHVSASYPSHTMRYVREDFRADVITSCILLWGHLTEWLRWWTRNPLGNSRVGSNPAVVGDNDFRQIFQHPPPACIAFACRGHMNLSNKRKKTHIKNKVKVRTVWAYERCERCACA